MLVHYSFTVRPQDREQVKTQLRRLKAVVERHGGRHFRYYASMTSGHPNRLFTYEIEEFRHFDALNADPEFRAVTLDSFYTDATGLVWGDVEI